MFKLPAILGTVTAVLASLLFLSRCEVNDLNKALGACHEANTIIADTANNNQEKFQACEVRRGELLEDVRIAEDAQLNANLAVVQLEQSNEELAARERRLREELYHDQTCSDVTDLYLCDDVVDSLRRASNNSPD